MRFLNKYKLHENFASASRKLPLRILKFKRPKWQKIQKKLRIRKYIWVNGKKVKNKPRVINLLKIPLQKKFFSNKIFTRKLQTRKYVSSLYDSSIKFKEKQKQTYRKKFLASILVKPIYRIDIFLWYLKFFVSSWAARHAINSGYVYVNSKRIKLNYIMKKGDIISFAFPVKTEELNGYSLIKAKFFRSKQAFAFPFLEYDYYTNTFIVLKDWNEFSDNDFSLMFGENKKFKCIL